MTKYSFLRWAGSKQKIIPQLREYWSIEFKRYIEPFVGSGQLFFSINPKNSILSDLNEELIEVYERIQSNPLAIHNILKKIPVDKDTYYKIRDLNSRSLGVNQRAARFIYLNRLCFNGLYRTNQKGHFNVPYGEKPNNEFIDDYEFLKSVSKKLKNVKLLTGDFESIIIKNIKKGDFVYLDPPYAVSNRRIFKQYGPQTFGIDDLFRLKQTLEIIDKKEGKFLLSYAYCKESVNMFSNWHLKKIYTQRNIAGFSEHRRKAAEVLITNITHG